QIRIAVAIEVCDGHGPGLLDEDVCGEPEGAISSAQKHGEPGWSRERQAVDHGQVNYAVLVEVANGEGGNAIAQECVDRRLERPISISQLNTHADDHGCAATQGQ